MHRGQTATTNIVCQINLYYNIPAVEAAKKIVDASGLKKVFFTNSGTEAIEGAIKVARKYAWLKDSSNEARHNEDSEFRIVPAFRDHIAGTEETYLMLLELLHNLLRVFCISTVILR